MKKITTWVVISVLSIVFAGCAVMPPKKHITELYDPIYHPAYNYAPKQNASTPAGYTVGVLNMRFEYEVVPPGSYVVNTGLGSQYQKDFVKAFSSGLEKIFISKGMKVSGPYDSYEEMTYPERSRCSFLVQPVVKLIFRASLANKRRLEEYDGPEGQGYTYLGGDFELVTSAEMEYVILDPLTQEKLERHKISTDPVGEKALGIFVQYVTRNSKGEITQKSWVPIWKDSHHRQEDNTVIIMGKSLDKLFTQYMAKVDGLVSVEEFNHLNQFKEELKERKRY